ncbi:DNA repair protein RecN [Flavobacterium urocaniciphilum]|uniref:DNA repair protein RecN n=1 Tax=Flavobacterium urocaniciphilum TaxID=1299341 RepID=A0A1H9DA78_9FLAO|nr:DNA repair protein RecN [Flavobacterium urocaniciphilum]SEQ10404.1 DNA replication and repair protein RecN [Flavobacterium urocaniciphilum]
MLLSLSVQNYALIEHLNINFTNQFATITGETGAGKSILLGALGLIMGNRADLSSLKDKEKKCVIEASFEVSKYNLQSLFEENDLDYENTTIIRREILPSGKSRAFINDTPVNLTELQLLAESLIDIHSQNQTRELEQENYQISILDAIGKNAENLKEYAVLLSDFKQKTKELDQIIAEKNTLFTAQEYNAYLLNELEQVGLQSNEQADLEEELLSLNNSELISETLSKIVSTANEEQFGFVNSLKDCRNALQKIANFSTAYSDLFERLNSSLIEIEDIAETAYQLGEKNVYNPERLEFISSRLQTIYDLQKKHQVATIDELLEIKNQLSEKVLLVDNLEDKIIALNQYLKDKKEELNTKAASITTNRREAIPVFIDKISSILFQLGMPDSQFKMELNAANQFLSNGKDELELLFSANKGTSLGSFKKVASGGEMSRIMLAIKSVLADFSKLPTIIFDEIDTGVSGEIALKMGEIMKKMSENRQVFAITHLPQIASKGDAQFKVSKETIAENTISKIVKLNAEERIVEIAEMLSGKQITDSALSHAKTLLN